MTEQPKQVHPSGGAQPTEPPVRRWTHGAAPTPPADPDPLTHFLRCALSYQNQLLAEIKTLLEKLMVEQTDT